MKFEYYTAKQKNAATYDQSQEIIDSELVTIEGCPPAAANAKITKYMPREDAEYILNEIEAGNEVTIVFN